MGSLRKLIDYLWCGSGGRHCVRVEVVPASGAVVQYEAASGAGRVLCRACCMALSSLSLPDDCCNRSYRPFRPKEIQV